MLGGELVVAGGRPVGGGGSSAPRTVSLIQPRCPLTPTQLLHRVGACPVCVRRPSECARARVCWPRVYVRACVGVPELQRADRVRVRFSTYTSERTGGECAARARYTTAVAAAGYGDTQSSHGRLV